VTAIRVGRVLHGTVAEGPGLRSAIWVQGCTIRCVGCINPQLFSRQGGSDRGTEKLVNEALEAGVEGFTFLGGEPFDQSDNLSDLAERAQSAGLGVITFTGYTYESLIAESEGHRRLIAATDLLVDGPYVASIPEIERALVGSANQRFLQLTDRYKSYNPVAEPNRVDVRIAADGTVDFAGFLDSARLALLAAPVGTRRKRSHEARVVPDQALDAHAVIRLGADS
jgi:anaerobic ribonucleoside-triphosphate reductase activating protein